MKKSISILLVFLCLLTALALPCFALDVDIRIRSDVQGLTYEQPEQMVDVSAGLVRQNIQINDYAGNVYLGAMKPGRTYYIQHSFAPENGFTLPEQLDESNTVILCDKGTSVYWYGITTGANNTHYAAFHTKVTVQGTPWQMFWGRIVDLWNKMLAWAPY